MKKFTILAMMFVGIILSQISMVSQAEASEIYAATERRGGQTLNYYVITESIQNTSNGFDVRTHITGTKNSYCSFGFAYYGGQWCLATNDGYPISNTPIPLSQTDDVMMSIFRVANQYR